MAVTVTLWMRFRGSGEDNSFTGSDPGQALLGEHFAAQSSTLTAGRRSAEKITSPEVQARSDAGAGAVPGAPHVTGVSDPYTTPGHLAADGHIAYVQFNIQGSGHPGKAGALIDARAASGDGVTFSLGGDLVDLAETPYGRPVQQGSGSGRRRSSC